MVKIWNEEVEGKCGKPWTAYIAVGVFTVLTDFLVILLPIPKIWTLQMPRRNKIVLTVLIGFGFM